MNFLIYSLSFLFLLVSMAGAEEPFLLRSFDAWENQIPELQPVFGHLRHVPRNWEKIGEVADILAHETGESSLQAVAGSYIALLAERNVKKTMDPSDAEYAIFKLHSLKERLEKIRPELSSAFYDDLMQCLDFEIACYRASMPGKSDDTIRFFNGFVEKNPLAPLGPDALKEMASLFIEKKDYNRGIAALHKIAKDFEAYPPLRFEAFYQCSLIEERMIPSSPKAFWFCHEAIKSTTDEISIQRARTRIDALRKNPKK